MFRIREVTQETLQEDLRKVKEVWLQSYLTTYSDSGLVIDLSIFIKTNHQFVNV